MKPRCGRKTKSGYWSWPRQTTGAIAGMMATVAIVAPARAATISAWDFDPDTSEFTLTLPAGVTPNYFLLAQPARIVLDLPTTALGSSISLEQQYAGGIRHIRLSEIQGGARVVLELSPDALLDPRHAELTSTDAGNGRTEWTLRPLLQDVPSSMPIAAEPPSPTATTTPDFDPIESPEPATGPDTPVSDPASTSPAETPETPPIPVLTTEAPIPTQPSNVLEESPSTEEEAIASIESEAPEPEDAQATVADEESPSSDDETIASLESEAPEPEDIPDNITDSEATEAELPLPEQPSSDQPTDESESVPLPVNGPAIAEAEVEAEIESAAQSVPDDIESTANQASASDPADSADDIAREAANEPEPLTVAVPAIPNAPSNESPSVPALPDVAQEATTGAARALPDGASELPDVSTDASILADINAETPATLSDQLPGEATTATRQSSVSVPPLVAVPDVPSRPDPGATTASVPTTEPPVVNAAPANDSLTSPAANETETQPLPPVAAAEATPPATSPTQMRPPQSEAMAGVPSSDNASIAAPPTAEVPPAAATNNPDNLISPPAAALPSPPAPTVATTTPPPSTAADGSTASNQSPPFLAEPGETPAREGVSIPPPPTAAQTNRTVPFGSPLPPQAKAAIEGAIAANAGNPISSGLIPAGTRLVLRYPGTETLTLTGEEPWYEVLIVTNDVYHPTTQERLLTAGTQVIGRFEGFDDSGQRFIAQVFLEGAARHGFLAESDALIGSPQPQSNNLLTNSGIGAAVITVLSGFSGVGLLGGAAIGAASTFATSPHVVTIEPGQLIEVEVIADVPQSSDALSQAQ